MMCAVLPRHWSLLSLHLLPHAPPVALLPLLLPLEVRRQPAHSAQREYGLVWWDLLPHSSAVTTESTGTTREAGPWEPATDSTQSRRRRNEGNRNCEESNTAYAILLCDVFRLCVSKLSMSDEDGSARMKGRKPYNYPKERHTWTRGSKVLCAARHLHSCRDDGFCLSRHVLWRWSSPCWTSCVSSTIWVMLELWWWSSPCRTSRTSSQSFGATRRWWSYLGNVPACCELNLLRWPPPRASCPARCQPRESCRLVSTARGLLIRSPGLHVLSARHQRFGSDGPRGVARQSSGWSPASSRVGRPFWHQWVVSQLVRVSCALVVVMCLCVLRVTCNRLTRIGIGSCQKFCENWWKLKKCEKCQKLTKTCRFFLKNFWKMWKTCKNVKNVWIFEKIVKKKQKCFKNEKCKEIENFVNFENFSIKCRKFETCVTCVNFVKFVKIYIFVKKKRRRRRKRRCRRGRKCVTVKMKKCKKNVKKKKN